MKSTSSIQEKMEKKHKKKGKNRERQKLKKEGVIFSEKETEKIKRNTIKYLI